MSSNNNGTNVENFNFDSLVQLMRLVFNARQAVIDRNSTSTSVPGWDSIAHVTLMLEIEETFGVAISPLEAARFENVGRLYDELNTRKNAGRANSTW